MKIMVIFGTRPEAIKMAPVIHELIRRKANLITVNTGQHSAAMVENILELFGLAPDYDLVSMAIGGGLADLGNRLMAGLKEIIGVEKPDYILVQGDTSSAFFGALVAFYHKIPVGHIEAGLRTYHRDPFPEEAHRRMITAIAQDHFAPTLAAAERLKEEHLTVGNKILVTGNTGIDALLSIADNMYIISNTVPIREKVLVTAHRRENHGVPLETICDNIIKLVTELPVDVIFPVHPNPNVQGVVHQKLDDIPHVTLTEPMDYKTTVKALKVCKLVITDSGGLQEEAPAMGKPVLVLRESTERPEGIGAGVAKLVGPNFYEAAKELLTDSQAYEKMAKAICPYGDGKASSRICDHILGGGLATNE